MATKSGANGRVTQVMGPVVDVEFPPGALPEILTALRTTNANIDARENNLVLEPRQWAVAGALDCLHPLSSFAPQTEHEAGIGQRTIG